MKNINQVENSSIKAQLPISALLQHYGGQCANKTSGAWWCIIHEVGGGSKGHKTPSLVAKDTIGTATCMSQNCFEADDIFGIIAKMEGLDIKSDFIAIKKMACSIAGILYENNNAQMPFKSSTTNIKNENKEIHKKRYKRF
jgi:hypothetical protein